MAMPDTEIIDSLKNPCGGMAGTVNCAMTPCTIAFA